MLRATCSARIRGFQEEIYESDMLLSAAPARPRLLEPFHEEPTISLVCTVHGPITREPLRPATPGTSHGLGRGRSLEATGGR